MTERKHTAKNPCAIRAELRIVDEQIAMAAKFLADLERATAAALTHIKLLKKKRHHITQTTP